MVFKGVAKAAAAVVLIDGVSALFQHAWPLLDFFLSFLCSTSPVSFHGYFSDIDGEFCWLSRHFYC